jgi:hypothetical protein
MSAVSLARQICEREELPSPWPSLSKLAGFRYALIQQFRTTRSAIPEPPKIRPLAFCTLRIDFICALCCLSAFTHYGFILMSQKNPETESVRDQQ